LESIISATRAGRKKIQTLAGAEKLVRRDIPTFCCPHNPNSFDCAAQLVLKLSLAGHTHGGQVQVEILDHRLSPRGYYDYIAGLYSCPLGMEGKEMPVKTSHLYVNRGLGP